MTGMGENANARRKSVFRGFARFCRALADFGLGGGVNVKSSENIAVDWDKTRQDLFKATGMSSNGWMVDMFR